MNTQSGLVKVLELIGTRKKPVLILVSGGSCSGKTTFSNVLYQKLGSEVTTVLHLDDYFKNVSDPTIPKDNRGCPLFDVPEAYTEQETTYAVKLLLQGRTIWVPKYDIPTNTRISAKGVEVRLNKVLVVDGLFAIRLLAPHFPEAISVYVRAEPEVRLQRRINRDTTRYHIPKQYVISYFLNTVMHYHELYVSSQRELAQVIVDTGQDFPEDYFD